MYVWVVGAGEGGTFTTNQLEVIIINQKILERIISVCDVSLQS